jgi:hypothetical protein
MIFSLNFLLCVKITDSFITPSMHNTQGDKIHITTTGFGLLVTDHQQVKSVVVVHRRYNKGICKTDTLQHIRTIYEYKHRHSQ